jgi:hypothetical protein
MGLPNAESDCITRGRAVRFSVLFLDFSGARGEIAGITLELDECLVIGGVVSLLLDNEEDPVESFRITGAMVESFDMIGVVMLVGEVW